jgi:hypothetical protein
MAEFSKLLSHMRFRISFGILFGNEEVKFRAATLTFGADPNAIKPAWNNLGYLGPDSSGAKWPTT